MSEGSWDWIGVKPDIKWGERTKRFELEAMQQGSGLSAEVSAPVPVLLQILRNEVKRALCGLFLHFYSFVD